MGRPATHRRASAARSLRSRAIFALEQARRNRLSAFYGKLLDLDAPRDNARIVATAKDWLREAQSWRRTRGAVLGVLP